MIRAGFALALLACAASASAQGLSDPMRPPGTGGPVQGAAAGTTDAVDAVAPAPRLQSVLLSRSRKLAVIDGKTVVLGGQLGDAKLVRISETEVVLKRGEEYETLRMLEGVSKKLIAKRTAQPPKAARPSSDRDRSPK